MWERKLTAKFTIGLELSLLPNVGKMLAPHSGLSV
jgi:hypothetical protein